MATWSNDSKNTSTLTNDSFVGNDLRTWDDMDIAWDDADGTWNEPRTPWKKDTKNTSTFTNDAVA